MKKISLSVLAVCFIFMTVFAQNEAINNYGLKGNPSFFRLRSYELSRDSLTGELVVGEEADSFSNESYNARFTPDGKEKVWHFVNRGRSCTSIQRCVDKDGKKYTLQIHNNELEKYTVDRLYKPVEQREGGFEIFYWLRDTYKLPFDNASDTVHLASTDTIVDVMHNGILQAEYQSEWNIVYENQYTAEGQMAIDFSQWLTAFRPKERIVRVYRQNKLIAERQYEANGELGYQKIFHYDDLGRLVLDRQEYKRTPVEEDVYEYMDTVAMDSSRLSENSAADAFWQHRYEYDSQPDEFGNWTSRNVFYLTDKMREEEPAWREERKIRYYKKRVGFER